MMRPTDIDLVIWLVGSFGLGFLVGMIVCAQIVSGWIKAGKLIRP